MRAISSRTWIWATLALALVLLGAHWRSSAAFGVETRRLLVSESFPDRADTLGVHDENCAGFLHAQFSPGAVRAADVLRGDLDAVGRATGLTWDTASLQEDFIDFNRGREQKNRVVYLAEVVHSTRTRDVVLTVGSDDDLAVWVNGDSVLRSHVARNTQAHDDLVRISLVRGDNVILYKVGQGTGEWSLYRRLVPLDRAEALLSTVNAVHESSDLPEAAIVSDTATRLVLKPTVATRGRVDSLLAIRYAWRPLDGGTDPSPGTLVPLPGGARAVPLPVRFGGSAVLDLQVVRPSTGELAYRERVPVYTEAEALRLARELSGGAAPADPMLAARREAVLRVFRLSGDTSTTYSTRMRAHALADLQRSLRDPAGSHRFPGPQTWGYRSPKDGTVQPFRVFVPDSLGGGGGRGGSRRYPVLILLAIGHHADMWVDKARSHHDMAEYAMLSTMAQVVTVVPHGRGEANFGEEAAEEIPLILEQLRARFPVDTGNVSILAWSYKTTPALKLLAAHPLPVSRLALVSAALDPPGIASGVLLRRIRDRNPELQWFVRHGANDTSTTVQVARGWMEQVRGTGFRLDYREVPHSTHWSYLFDPVKEFYSEISNEGISAHVR